MIRKKYFSMLISASFTSIINVLLIIADSIICGQMLSDTAVAAIDLITPLYTFCMFISMLLSLGIPILYSRAMGRSQKNEADLVFGTGLTVTIIGGILIFFFLTVFRDAYFSQYELSNELYLLAKDYYFWIRFEILVMPLAEVMVESVFADGDESCTLLVSIVETSTNVILSVILCRTMGIAGVALASFVAVSLRLLISLTHFLKKSNSLRVHLSFSLAQEINASDSSGRSPGLWPGFTRSLRAFSSLAQWHLRRPCAKYSNGCCAGFSPASLFTRAANAPGHPNCIFNYRVKYISNA